MSSLDDDIAATVSRIVFDEDVYLQACDEIESNVRLPPEWLGADHEGFGLEHAIEQKDYEEAEQALVETFQSYIKSYHRRRNLWAAIQSVGLV